MKPQIIFPHIDGQGIVAGGCDGDCACSLPALDVKKTLATNERLINLHEYRYFLKGQVSSLPLSDDFWVVTAPDSYTGWAVANRAALRVFEFFQAAHSLDEWTETDFIPTEEFTETAQLLYLAGFLSSDYQIEVQQDNSAASFLETWLFLTRSCNMACAHCYVQKDAHHMSLATGRLSIEKLFALAREKNYLGVKIKYAGGEPTMRWNLFTQLHEYAVTLSQVYQQDLAEILVTNGAALSQKRLEYLKQSGIKIAISLDGFGAGHDRQRPFMSGLPTFERVHKNILLALELGLKPYLTMTITRLNIDDVPDITQFALQNKMSLNWNFYRPTTPNDPLVPDRERLIFTLEKALTLVEKNAPDYPFVDRLIDRSNFHAPHEYTCGAGRHYLSIDYNGMVSPCHMLANQSQQGPSIQQISASAFPNFLNPRVDEKDNCNVCQWRYWCTGGCSLLPRETQLLYCSVYKAIYPKIIEIKAKQLLPET